MTNPYHKSYIKNLIGSWKIQSKNEYWAKQSGLITQKLDELEKAALKFDDKEYEFLEFFYINFSDGNTRSTKILELGENYKHAEYFFINKFLENNIAAFYSNFVFKNNILEQKNSFLNMTSVSVSEIFKDSNKNIISLYIFIENIAKNFEDYSKDREKKDIFKRKLIKFYDALYELLEVASARLLKEYFNIVLNNQPLMIAELIKKCLLTDSFSKVNSFFTDEHALNSKQIDSDNFEILKHDLLWEFISILSIKNSQIGICLYSKHSKKILETLFEEKIPDFAKFCERSTDFVESYTPYPEFAKSKEEKFLYSSLFFDYILGFEEELIGKNVIYYGPVGSGKSHKIREIIKIKNPDNDKIRSIIFHDNYKYEDFIDGFVNGEFTDGEFKQLCKKAIQNPQEEFFFVIDNIGNGKIETIFGEALELINSRYDENSHNTTSIRTKNSHIIDGFDDEKKEKHSIIIKDGLSYFAIPQNLYIIAATNGYKDFEDTAPSTVNAFKWVKLGCNYTVLENFLSRHEIKNASSCVRICKMLNEYIKNDLKLGENFELGHGIYMNLYKFQINFAITDVSVSAFFDEYIEPLLKTIFIQRILDKDISRQLKVARDLFKLD